MLNAEHTLAWQVLAHHGTDDTRRKEVALLLHMCGAQMNELLAKLDPLQENFGYQVQEALDDLMPTLWRELRRVMAVGSDAEILQQAWAVQVKSPTLAGLLFRAGLLGSGTPDEARRLRDISLARWATPYFLDSSQRDRSVGAFLMSEDLAQAPVPDLNEIKEFAPRVRLRYGLAKGYREGDSIAALLTTAARLPGPQASNRSAAIYRVVRYGLAHARQWRRMGSLEFALLHRKAQMLLLATPRLWPMVLSQEMTQVPDVAQHARGLMTQVETIRALLREVMGAVRLRKLEQAEVLIQQVQHTPLADALCRELRDGPWALEREVTSLNRSDATNHWTPLSPQSAQRLSQWVQRDLPRWWCLSASEVARQLCSAELGNAQDIARSIWTRDLYALQGSWTVIEHRQLIDADAGCLVPEDSPAWQDVALEQLVKVLSVSINPGLRPLAVRLGRMPDARPWIALMAQAASPSESSWLRQLAENAMRAHWPYERRLRWAQWVAPCWGCEGWAQVQEVALARTQPLDDAVEMFTQGRMPLVPGAFQEVLARVIHLSKDSVGRPYARAPLMMRLQGWLLRDPLAIHALVAHAPESLQRSLARHRSTPMRSLEVLMRSAFVPVREAATRHLARRLAASQKLAVQAAP